MHSTQTISHAPTSSRTEEKMRWRKLAKKNVKSGGKLEKGWKIAHENREKNRELHIVHHWENVCTYKYIFVGFFCCTNSRKRRNKKDFHLESVAMCEKSRKSSSSGGGAASCKKCVEETCSLWTKVVPRNWDENREKVSAVIKVIEIDFTKHLL